MAPKKRKVEEEEVDLDDVSEDEEPVKKSPKPRKPKAPKAAWVDSTGWHAEPERFLLWKDYGSTPNATVAAFDMDGTLVNKKSDGFVPLDADDWQLFNASVPAVLKKYADEGHKIAIFSNQGTIRGALDGKAAEKIKAMIDKIVAAVGVPCQVFLATASSKEPGDTRKPGTGMWRKMAAECNGGVAPDLDKCFFVGDAADVSTDFADSDRVFAEAIGIAFKKPEEVFGAMEGQKKAPGGAGRGGGAAAAAAVDFSASPNALLCEVFAKIAKHHLALGGNSFHKGNAFNKVAKILSGAAGADSFTEKVTLDNLKSVGNVKGVGKGSLKIMKEVLETGTCEELTLIEGGGGGGASASASSPAKAAAPAKPSKEAAMASHFM